MDVRPTKHDNMYFVTSETGNGEYQLVCVNNRWMCTCMYFQKKKLPCKHIGRMLEHLQETEDESINGVKGGLSLPPHALNGTSSSSAPSIGKWVKQIHGQDFIQYCGLLAMAHEQGLISLSASFVSVTSELAIAIAFAVFKDGRKFFEAADATPQNVSPGVKAHFPRVALTRAKARVLRDALNIGMVAVEELEE